jgi:hypothetical protein
VLRFDVIGLRKERPIHVKAPVILVILVPFVLPVIDLIVHRRPCKMQLPSEFGYQSESDFPNQRALFTSFGAILIMSPGAKHDQCRTEERHVENRTVFSMEVRTQGR